jgi:hypothetical protein
MQSMEILIVICRDEPRRQKLPAAAWPLHVAECTAESAKLKMTVCKLGLQPVSREKRKKKRRHALNIRNTAFSNKTARRRLLVVLGLEDFTATVETVRADVVTQVGFAGGRLDCQVWCNQEIVRTVHAALGRGLLILLNCHDDS